MSIYFILDTPVGIRDTLRPKWSKTLSVWSLISSEGQTIKEVKSKNTACWRVISNMEKGVRRTGSVGEKGEILNRMIREGHTEKATFKQKLEGDEGMRHVDS